MRRRLSLLLPLLWLLASVLPAAASDVPRQRYRDRVYKFSFKMFDKWSQVPIENGEKIDVAKFVEGTDRGDLAPTLTVVRLNLKEGGDGPVVTPGLPEGLPPEIKARLAALEAPKCAWDATIGQMRLPDGFKPDRSKFDEIESKDDVKGKMWSLEVDYGGDYGDYKIYVSLIDFVKDDLEYGIFFRCPATRRKSFERGLVVLGRSFEFHDEKAKDVETLDVLDGVAITPERRREIERSLIQGWKVIVSPKKQYVVIYNTKHERNNQLAEEIARRIELIREQIYEKQFPPAHPITAVSIVRVCGDRKEYFAYGGPGGSAGYWNSQAEELVFYDASPSKAIDDDTVAVLYHEAFHQYIYYSVGDVAPHSWFNEGHGDYYAGAQLKGKKFKLEPFRWRMGIIRAAVQHGPRAKATVQGDDGKSHEQWANDGGYTPLRDFVRFTQGQYYAYPDVSYAEGWSLIYFLREIVPKNREYREKWGKILDTYFDTLKASVAATRRETTPSDAGPAAPTPPGGEKPKGPGEEPWDGGGDAPGAKPGGGDEGGSSGEKPGDEGGSPKKPGGDDDGGDSGGPDGGEPEGWIPPPVYGRTGADALDRAVKAAFEGVDFDELEAAWAKAVLHEIK